MEFCIKCHNLYNIKSKNNIPVFICETCQYTQPIKENTELFEQKSYRGYLTSDPITLGNPKEKINSNVTMKTKNYTCPNKQCTTHKQPNLKEATIERFNHQSYQIYYICNICMTRWY